MAQTVITAFIEIPAMGTVKYEVDKKTGRLFVDRFLKPSMYYPCNYGAIPETLAGDGDELDVLVITPAPVQAGVYIECRPIGVLNMTDEKGEDAKIIALPLDDKKPIDSIADLEKIDPDCLNALRHFFEHYKGLDEGKWVKVQPGFGDKKEAEKLIKSTQDAFLAQEEAL